MTYLNWDTKTITDFSENTIEKMYDEGYVFTRIDKGVMNRTRSFRITLPQFELSSENRRILRKSAHLALSLESIPYNAYSWEIGKLAKDFYEKFGDSVFTANKIKEVLTDAQKSNFNRLFVFTNTITGKAVGYCIAFESKDIIHYSYPFYIEESAEPSRGLGMMTAVISWAKEMKKKYVYLGSLQRPSDTYKLQFTGSEWFDGTKWQTDITPLKKILTL